MRSPVSGVIARLVRPNVSNVNTRPEGISSLNFSCVEMSVGLRGRFDNSNVEPFGAPSMKRLMSAALMAKFRFWPSACDKVFRPSSLPSMSTSGPPLLPPEMAAVV